MRGLFYNGVVWGLGDLGSPIGKSSSSSALDSLLSTSQSRRPRASPHPSPQPRTEHHIGHHQPPVNHVRQAMLAHARSAHAHAHNAQRQGRAKLAPRRRAAQPARATAQPPSASSAAAPSSEITSTSTTATPPPRQQKQSRYATSPLPGPSSGTSASDPVDLVIVGCGPAGLAAAAAAGKRGLRVVLVDPEPDKPWPNNYGVWLDEFDELGLSHTMRKVWKSARVVFEAPDCTDGEGRPDAVLRRPYGQVDRIKLKAELIAQCKEYGVACVAAKADAVDHDSYSPNVSALKISGTAAENLPYDAIYARSVLDATGHSRRLVEFDQEFTPGYQAAYGILAKVKSHPFPLDEMLFMDWSDTHLDNSPQWKEINRRIPTFLYVMPFDEQTIFLEETSLVARPALDFDDLKEKLDIRLAHLGVEVLDVEEVEYCLIPMGGVMPTLPQRTLGLGGTAGMVHPSTGFMVSKTIKSAATLADSLAVSLKRDSPAAQDEMSTSVWNSIWTPADIRQRSFMCFGMETLMQLDVRGIREFFSTFFELQDKYWAGFLSWRLPPFALIQLGLSLFKGFTNTMRLEFVSSALPFMPSFIVNFANGGNTFKSEPWMGAGADHVLEGKSSSKRREVLNRNGYVDGVGPIPSCVPVSTTTAAAATTTSDAIDIEAGPSFSGMREDWDWVRFQQSKALPTQAPLADQLPEPKSTSSDVIVVGCGPAGLALAAAMGRQGLSVTVVGPDAPFTNNYGVWYDEFEELGLAHTLEHVYDRARIWIDDNDDAAGRVLDRTYAQVDRKALREELIAQCLSSGNVSYVNALVDTIKPETSDESGMETGRSVVIMDDVPAGGNDDDEATSSTPAKPEPCVANVICMATGHNRELLKYEEGPPPGWQTAYGIEIRLNDHPFPKTDVVFMDFRQSDPEPSDGDMGALPTAWRVPSFLYTLPKLSDPDVVFVEETCLVARVQVPFDELRRRLLRRLTRMGIDVNSVEVLEEEASWIPLGGTLPKVPQRYLAYGAAAGFVHPASGYSITHSLSRADSVAAAVARGLRDTGAGDMRERSQLAVTEGWEELWGYEKRRQMGFYQFGMELIMSLRLPQLRNFFDTFFRLDRESWVGFLSHRLSGVGLLMFAFQTFLIADLDLRVRLVSHLASQSGAGQRLFEAYAKPLTDMLSGTEAADESHSSRPAMISPPSQVSASIDEDDDGIIVRKEPPQPSASSVFSNEQNAQALDGLPPGFQAADWWRVGVRDAPAAYGSPEAGGYWWSDGSVMRSPINGQQLPNSAAAEPTDMPGSYGFDPLGVGNDTDLQTLRQSELLHGRWAMLAVLGVILPETGSLLSGADTTQFHWWAPYGYDMADKQLLYMGAPLPLGLPLVALLHFPLMGAAELLRAGKLKVPAGLRELDPVYPGGIFDPLGLAPAAGDDLPRLKEIEVNTARVAMIAFYTFVWEAILFHKGPIEIFVR